MQFQRSAGALLHVTSLPTAPGIGDLGPGVDRWLDWLASTGCHLWQILPLVPTGFGHSPYASPSAFAGNPLLISPAGLVEAGWLDDADVADPPAATDPVDYDAVATWKGALLQRAHERFVETATPHDLEALAAFRAQEEWLEHYALFMAIQESQGGKPWWQWPATLRNHDPAALAVAHADHAEAIERQVFIQWQFDQQWRRVHAEARSRDIAIIGDIPLYVAHDSADVWAHRELFAIKADGSAEFVAGVPPDMFSDTGQRWGNPQYRWDAHRQEGYEWWIRRLASNFARVDILRIDHFTGFARYWNIPGDEPTAEHGEWLDGPGMHFFDAAERALGRLPIIAEDLGPLGDEVEELRRATGFPGMKILQMAFSDDELFLPHHYSEDFVAYPGTHDNDTAAGWWSQAPDAERAAAMAYLDTDGSDIAWDLVEAVWQSKALMAVAAMQDFLGLGTEARMNTPATVQGNWRWRVSDQDLTSDLAERVRELTTASDRARPPF